MTGSVLLFAPLPINSPIGLTNSLEAWLWDHRLVALLSPPRLIPSDGETGNNSVTSSLPTIHSEQLNWSCYARNAKSPNFHKRFNQERSI
jgi:hypothetical protein